MPPRQAGATANVCDPLRATHRVLARLPVCGADLTVRVGVLEGLDQAERLVDAAAHRQVVDGDLPEDALRVDDEKAAASVVCGACKQGIKGSRVTW